VVLDVCREKMVARAAGTDDEAVEEEVGCWGRRRLALPVVVWVAVEVSGLTGEGGEL